MLVEKASAGDPTVRVARRGARRLGAALRRRTDAAVRSAMNTKSKEPHTPATLRSCLPEVLNASDTDVVHLHWVANGMLSVSDIGRIRKPVVWTLHDMWAFCGAEHYSEDDRWREGYRRSNRPEHESGFDLNRWTWHRKRRCWKQQMHIVGNSRWTAQCASESLLMNEWPSQVILLPLNLSTWRPIEKPIARQSLGFPVNAPLLAFGAIGGGSAPRKGFDLLLDSLRSLRGQIPDLELVVFGQSPPEQVPDIGFRMHFMGHLHDDISLRTVYSAVDAMVVPSRQEAYGQTASEAHACGTPVVAFGVGGLPDTVDHLKTGYLAQPLDTEDLARGIAWVLDHPDPQILRHHARQKAVSCFSAPKIASQYIDLYNSIT